MRTDNLVIGIGGWDNSGKDTVAQLLVVELEKQTGVKAEIIGMSDTLKRIIYTMDPLVRNGDEVQHFREITREYELVGISERKAYEMAKEIPDVRNFLRKMGNVVGRQIIDPYIWSSLARRAIFDRIDEAHVIVTGIRHPTDLELIREYGNKSLHVHRPGCEPTDQGKGEGQLSAVDFKYGLTNGGTIDHLKGVVVPATAKALLLGTDFQRAN